MRFFQHRSKEAKGNLPMIILSLLLAILIWLVVAMTLYPSIPKTIENIPLSVDIAGSPAADSGLSVISCDVDTVDVQLVGSRTQIGNLNAENLTAYVDYENVTSTGKKTLSIKVKSDSGINYEVKSITPSTAVVELDKYDTLPFEVKPKIPNVKYAEGKTIDPDEFTCEPDIINITGPSAQLAKISSVYAVSDRNLTLDSSYTLNSDEVQLFSEDGTRIDASSLLFDTSNGSTAVYVEPNYADEDFPFVNFTLKSMDRVVYRVRPIAEEIDIEWTTQSRQDVTQQIEAISDNIEITLTDDELKQLGYTYDNKLTLSDVDIDMKLQIGLDGSNVDPILLDSLNDEQLAVFGIGRDPNERYYILSPSAEVIDSAGAGSGKKIYFSEIDSDTIEKFQSEYLDEYYDYKFKVTKDRTVLLNTLTDEQLKSFGVSDQSDVMTFNGKVCFRSYVAEIEDYYDVDSRHLSIDLLT